MSTPDAERYAERAKNEIGRKEQIEELAKAIELLAERVSYLEREVKRLAEARTR